MCSYLERYKLLLGANNINKSQLFRVSLRNLEKQRKADILADVTGWIPEYLATVAG